MGRIDRYLLREIALPFALSLALVITAVVLIQARRLATAALGFGLTLEDAAVIFLAAIPPFLTLAVPIAFLLAVLVGYGRLGADLELVALRSAGASPLRLIRVPLLLGLVVSAVTVPIASVGEAYGLRVLHDRLIDVGMRNLTSAITPGVFNEDFQGSALFASSRTDDGALHGILLYDDRDPEHAALVTARSGTFTSEQSSGVAFELSEGEIHLGTTSTVNRYDRVLFERAHLGLDAERELSKRTAFVSIVGRMTSEEMLAEVVRLGPDSALGRRIEKMYWRRFAFPSMAVILGLAGAAIALTGSPRSRARSATLGVTTVVGYYVLTRIADFVVVQYTGTPFWMAWIPNILVLTIALFAIVRSGRAKA